MKVKFWGVRGSIPSPGPKTMRVGGNTSCVEILPGGDRQFIVDAGTGIRELGLNMMGRNNVGRVKASIFLSHTHWDHIHGFPFFVPAFIPGNSFTMYGPVNAIEGEKLEKIIADQMQFKYFPVPLRHLGAKFEFKELQKMPPFYIDDVRISTELLNHPITVLGYRFEYEEKIVVTMFDTEPFRNQFLEKKKNPDPIFDDDDDDDSAFVEEGQRAVDESNHRVREFARDADLLIFDAQYTADEYKTKIGWGHSSYDDAIAVATEMNVKRLAFFHHDPTRTDNAIEEIEKDIQDKLYAMGRRDVHIFAAREGMEIDL